MTIELPPLPETPVLETERMILRPMRLTDAPAVQRWFPDWELVKHLHAGLPWPYPADGAETNMRECLERMDRGEMACWAMTLKGDDTLIGRIDIKPNAEERDMRGFWLARPRWGQGLMTEAAEAVTGYAFEVLGWPFLYVNNAADNQRSHRVKEKQGAELIDLKPHAFMCGELMRETWILRRETWLARRGRP
ncbi:GNAT family N-acetyltransferase [Phenylobacterium sp.]|uniref:GNAT family N-acetyltransferase n=1 Tax=Phenylobacterium sp. TaxID=1871053 RepID=UPI002DEEF6DE|nr:GNAT family N-acetyltransferase [Phenylobacterium sp.]